jgi:spore germination cell wall hydrolase CwlJ-like protein
MTRGPLGLAALAAAFLAAAAARAGEPSGREVRCLGLVAFTEAAVDGPPGMAAVVRVVRNRAADPRFPDDACAVVAQVAQFQPVARSAVLQKVVRDPEGYDIPQVVGARSPRARRLLPEALRLAREPLRSPDPTGVRRTSSTPR